jgi:hypothetical protein
VKERGRLAACPVGTVGYLKRRRDRFNGCEVRELDEE